MRLQREFVLCGTHPFSEAGDPKNLSSENQEGERHRDPAPRSTCTGRSLYGPVFNRRDRRRRRQNLS